MSRITIQEVTVSTVTKGKNSYQVAEVTFTTDRGENKTKKVMSFSNPAVFAIVSKVKYPTAFEATNDGAPYYNWTKLEPVADEVSQQAAPKATGGRVVGSTYETAEERKIKQMYIIRQSSISNAIDYLKLDNGREHNGGVESVLSIAQEFVDFVYQTDNILETLDGNNSGISEE